MIFQITGHRDAKFAGRAEHYGLDTALGGVDAL